MMLTEYYALLAIAGFTFLGVTFISEIKPKKLKRRSNPQLEPDPQTATENDYAVLHDIADAHTDYTAEVAEVLVCDEDREFAKILPVGVKFQLRINPVIE